MNLETAIVVNEAQFSEAAHQEADPRAGGDDHFRQHLLADLDDYLLGFALLAEMGEQQKMRASPLSRELKS